MRLVAISTLAAVSLLAAGCSKNDHDSDDALPASTSASDAAAISSSVANPDQTFVDAAAASDAFEIQSSQLAATKATSDKVKAFAEEMIKAHTASTAKLKSVAAGATPALTPNPTLPPAQQARLDALSSKSGADFNKAYSLAQIDAHQATLSALKSYAANGDMPGLKEFAGSLVPTVNDHLKMAQGL